MKLRLLNGAHTTLAAMGRPAGYDTVAGADLPMTDPVLAGWAARPTAAMPPARAVRRWLDDGPVFGSDLAQDGTLADDLTRALTALRDRGVVAVLAAWLAGR